MSEFDSLKRVSQELVAVVIATSGSNEPQILFKYPYKNCSERNDSYKCLEEFLKFEESTLCYLCLSQMNILHIELDNLTLIGRPTHLDVDDNQSSGILADAMAIAEYFDSYLSSVLLKFGFESPYQSLTRKSSCDVSFQGIYSSVSETNLGVLIKNVYDGIIERSEVHVYVNNVSYISYIFHSDVVNMKQVVNGIKPYHALVLLFDSSKDALKCLPENHSPNVSKVLQCISSDKNLIYLAHDCGLSLQQLLSIAKHLVYWKIARVVYPIMRANRYSVNPDFPISRRDLLTFLHDKLLGELRDGTYSDKLYTRDNGNIIVHILSKIPTCGSVEALSPLTKDWPFILIIVTFLLRFNCIRQILLYPLFHSTGAEIDSPTGIKLSEIKQYLEGFHSVEHIAHILEVHRSDIISTMDEHKDSIFHFWRESQDLPDICSRMTQCVELYWSVAPYSYTTSDGTPCEFEENEVFLISERTNDEWWYVERVSDATGMFVPASFITPLPRTHAAWQDYMSSPDVICNESTEIELNTIPENEQASESANNAKSASAPTTPMSVVLRTPSVVIHSDDAESIPPTPPARAKSLYEFSDSKSLYVENDISDSDGGAIDDKDGLARQHSLSATNVVSSLDNPLYAACDDIILSKTGIPHDIDRKKLAFHKRNLSSSALNIIQSDINPSRLHQHRRREPPKNSAVPKVSHFKGSKSEDYLTIKYQKENHFFRRVSWEISSHLFSFNVASATINMIKKKNRSTIKLKQFTKEATLYLRSEDQPFILDSWYKTLSAVIDKNKLNPSYVFDPSILKKDFLKPTKATDKKKNVTQESLLTKLSNFLLNRPSLEEMNKTGTIRYRVFGAKLSAVCVNKEPPTFLTNLLHSIEQKGSHLEGLYRVSGNQAEVQKLRFAIDENRDMSFEHINDVHVLAGTVKLYFKEMHTPLFPDEFQEKMQNILGLEEVSEKIKSFSAIFKEFPPENANTIKLFCSHLHRIAQSKNLNKMSTENLSICIGPVLVWTSLQSSENAYMALGNTIQNNSIVEFTINYVYSIFPDLEAP